MRHLGSQFQIVSTNMYYEFEPGEMALRGVQKVGDGLDLVSARIAAHNAQHGTSIGHVIGEHGNTLDFDYSVNPPVQLDSADFNMCYQGAVTTADFLMMASNMPELERIHHFIWGNSGAVWRPITSAIVGGQTVFSITPSAELYRALGSRILDQSVSAATTSAAGSDGETYAVRGGAFRSADGARVSVILVNRDPAVDHTIDVAGTNGWALTSATIMTGDAAHGFTSHVDPFPITPLQTSFAVPHLAVLMLDYRPATLDAGHAAQPDGVAFTGAVPNPGVSSMRLDYSVRADTRVRLQLFDALGRRVRTLRDGVDRAGTHAVAWNGRDDSGRRVPRGVYLARLEADRRSITRRIVLVD